MRPARILLLEDDVNLSETVAEYLGDAGFEVVCAYDGEHAQELLYEARFDLLLLDVNVPGMNGFALLSEARGSGTATPAIFMTSRNAMRDVEHGFASGADDYIRKPFELMELLLRIRAILRRDFFHNPSESLDLGDGLAYDVSAGILYKEGVRMALGDKPARLLRLFVQRRGQLISHETISEHVWDYEEEPSDAALRTYIKELRKLLGKERIVSYKRLGYQFS